MWSNGFKQLLDLVFIQLEVCLEKSSILLRTLNIKQKEKLPSQHWKGLRSAQYLMTHEHQTEFDRRIESPKAPNVINILPNVF